MPEGDTILRTARNLSRWLTGRQITAARSPALGAAATSLVGRRVVAVEAKAKHVLIHFSAPPEGRPVTLRTHQRMRGVWHVYQKGAPWRLPEHQARAVLVSGDRVAVCFNSPEIELFASRDEPVVPALRALGPDVLAQPVTGAEVWARAEERQPADTTVAEVLLDQRVVSGIGNIYRSETLFVCGVDPWRPWTSVGVERLGQLVSVAGELMRANVDAAHDGRRGFGGGPGRPWVYGRHGRPCRRCGELIRSARIGRQPRTVWWCPSCQVQADGQRRSRNSADSQDQHSWSSSGPT